MSGKAFSPDAAGGAEDFWEAHYRRHEQVWSGRPNAVLTDVVADLPPGRALDLGCGEGGDALWLAELGWQVTAVDVSATALERVAARAAEAGLEARIEVRRHDLGESFPPGAYDLVSAQFLQSPVAFPRARALQAAAGAVAPGGLLLVVEHGSVPPWAGHGHEHPPPPPPEELLAVLDLEPGRWTTERLGAPERMATGPDGRTAPLLDNVLAVRRGAG